MISTAPQASNSVYGKVKCFKYINRTVRIVQWQRGPVVWLLTSRAGSQHSVGLNLGVIINLFRFLYTFFLFRFFSTHFCPLACFPVFSLLTPYSLV